MIIFEIDTTKLKVIDQPVILAVYGLMDLQDHNCFVSKIDQGTYYFKLKSTLNPTQRERLFADKVAEVLPGYSGRIEQIDKDYFLVVSK